MATYAVFFNGKQTEIQADSLYAAKVQAVATLKPRKSQEHMISVVLTARTDSSLVTHVADF